MTRGSILVFGGSTLQLSLIKECVKYGLKTIVIDPDIDAIGKGHCHHFECVSGNDYNQTCLVINKYNINAIITTATDKPLKMMAKIAEKYKLPFISYSTSLKTTNKFLMKEVFLQHGIPCAKGNKYTSCPELLDFPVIVKPLDNSGSRGVFYCKNMYSLKKAYQQAKVHTKLKTLLIEEYITGKEYSIESLHVDNKTFLIQITEKKTTPLPYNTEIGHTCPTFLNKKIRTEIKLLLGKIASAFNYDNCAAHTEIKVNSEGVYVIETSPRLGGDFITSKLVPLSTGINIEQELIKISLGDSSPTFAFIEKYSAIRFLNFPQGMVKSLGDINDITKVAGVVDFVTSIDTGFIVKDFKNSTERYGYVIYQTDSLKSMEKAIEQVNQIIQDNVKIEII